MNWFSILLQRLAVALGALAMTLALFLLLPVLKAITKTPESDLVLQSIDTASLPPPPPIEEELEEEEPEPEEEPPLPELTEEAPPLDLAQLELALQPGFGSGAGALGDFTIQLNVQTARSGPGSENDFFSVDDLDQKPRLLYTTNPVLNSETRRKAPGKVFVLFTVDPSGRVESPSVVSSTDPVFEKPALAAVKQWKFEPGKRNGQAVRFRMRVPITFPKS